MARRIGNLSIGFRRALAKLGFAPGSPQRLAVGATVSALMTTDELPGAGDSRTTFAPGVAHVRRVPGRNLWILYRFDDARLDVLMIRETPPVPTTRTTERQASLPTTGRHRRAFVSLFAGRRG